MCEKPMERLFGGAPRPPYGLEISTRTEEVYAYLREVSDLIAEGAVEEVGRLLEDHSVGIDDSQFILSSVKLLFEDLVFRIKTGGPDSPEVPGVRQSDDKPAACMASMARAESGRQQAGRPGWLPERP